MAATGRIDELKKRYDENPRRFFAPLANEYRKSGDLELAITLCRQHLAEAPQNLSGQIVFGQALFDSGTFDESRIAFETAIGLDPENLIALRHLGDIARAQSDVPRAREWFQRLLDADRRNDEVLAIMKELAALEAAGPPAAPPAPASDPAPDQAMVIEPTSFAGQPASALPTLLEPESEPEPVAYAPPPIPPPMPRRITPSADVPTVEIPALRRPEPIEEPPPAPSYEPEPVAMDAHPPIDVEGLDFGAPDASVVESGAPAPSADSAFGFDVDLGSAAAIPAAEAAYDSADMAAETTSGFGDVELPNDSPFGDASDLTSASPFGSPDDAAAMSAALTTPEPPIEPPSVPEFETAEPTPASAAELESARALPEFDVAESAPPPIEAEAPPRRESAPALDAFELEDAGETPAEESASTFASFDPVRSMPTPVAPRTPIASETPIGSETPIEATPYVEAPLYDAPLPDIAPVEAAAAAAPPAPPIATETMAELYVKQGLRHEAIAVYRELIAARPHDPSLRARVAELEAEDHAAAPSNARSFFARLAGRRATPVRPQTPVRPATPVESSATIRTTPPRSSTPVRSSTPIRGSTPIRSATPIDAAPVVDYGAPLPPIDESPMDVVESAAPAPEAPVEAAPVAGGTLDALFGHSDVAAPDDNAAQSLAAAFGSPPPPVAGRPTRAASDEFSLDSVFREQSATPSQGGLSVPRQSKNLRFDQFFAGGAAEPGAEKRDTPPADPGGDSEQFQSWLSGLKKP